MLKPDYSGRSIVNLMASISRGLGVKPGIYQPFSGLSPDTVARHQNVILLVLDGLGYNFLKNKVPDSFIARHINHSLTSVFPSTTASAITTFGTGYPPQQHAITGWHMYFSELDQVMAVLPFHPRDPLVKHHYDLAKIQEVLDLSSLMDKISRQKFVVSPQYIVDSDYNQILSGKANRIGYKGINDCFSQIANVCKMNNREKYIYAYWPDFDSNCHQYGIDSTETLSLFEDLDAELQLLVDKLVGQDYLLLVTADHGLIDTNAQNSILLNDFPDVRQYLSQPLCGEPRAAYCYVKPDSHAEFESAVQQKLSNYCEIMKSSEVVEEGFFGLGPAHSRLLQRIGDYILVMKENYIIKDLMPEEKLFAPIGVHGGLSRNEMQVPLIMFSNK